jgi:propionyl-CoA carboxylase alpha chain
MSSEVKIQRPLTKLLIANRGEIARRIGRTAHAMGISTVAVYADSDRDAPFVREADEAASLAGRSAAETYLDVGKILAVARAVGADAVHPGYGFLSENAAFAQAVRDAGLIWVGPSPEAIAAMGDKVEAKKRLEGAGVPLLPSFELDQLGAGGQLEEAALAIGFPLLVKAAAGGGGKGMRVVRSAEALVESVAAAQREAQAAFGSPRVFLERFVERARHVEIQLLGDEHGNLVHCFERECSIQRRHQKIVEESPSPVLDEALRQRMGEVAVAAGKAIGYSSTGTVEFLLEEPGAEADLGAPSQFWFLEVNTRLQVEHPVTEEITGLDLVREQLRIAAGEPLGFSQDDLQRNGHAIEVRLYAEDPASSFLPTTGTLVTFDVPAGRSGLTKVRVDTGFETGSVVGIEFDPMLAKVIAHAPTRREAALALARTLERSVIQGLVTNRDYLVATLRSAEFLAGDTTIDFVERVGLPGRRELSPVDQSDAALLAAFSALLARRTAARVQRSIPPAWRNTVMPPEEVRYAVSAGDEVVVQYRARRDGSFSAWVDLLPRSAAAGTVAGDPASAADPTTLWELTPAAQPLHVEILETSASGTLALAVDGRRVHGAVHGATPEHPHGLVGGAIWVATAGTDVELTPLARFPDAAAAQRVGGLTAPMPGKVLAVHVALGDVVEEGQLLLVLEAMKMEHRVTAPHAGTVTGISVAAGDQVSGGAELALIAEVA